MFGDATADADGVVVFAIGSDTGLNCISAWSRSTAWRYILPTAERNSGGDGVQSGVRRRVAAVDSWYSASAMRHDEGHNHTVRNIGTSEKRCAPSSQRTGSQ
jgi:hypothetical protein